MDRASYSGSDQSSSTGQRSEPVRSWWNPRSILIWRERDGRRGWSRGVIQSMIGPFKLLVSSDRALDIPFWICRGNSDYWDYQCWALTNSEILWTSPSSMSLSMILSWSPGIILKSALNIWISRRSLESVSSTLYTLGCFFYTYSLLKDSSGSSAKSPARMSPFMMIDWMVHKACTVRPKCRPWWTRGSERRLRSCEHAFC